MSCRGGKQARRKKPRRSSRESQRFSPPPPSPVPLLVSSAFATLFVNYLVIECEEAESHRLNYHSWRATGGLIVYHHSGDVGMRKGRAPEIIPRFSPPASLSRLSTVHRGVFQLFFFPPVFFSYEGRGIGALRKTGLPAIPSPEILIKQRDEITVSSAPHTLTLPDVPAYFA